MKKSKTPEYHLVRITAKAYRALVKFTTEKNAETMRVNASHFISFAVMNEIARDKGEKP